NFMKASWVTSLPFELFFAARSPSRKNWRTPDAIAAPFLLSGAGSAWYDVVAEEFSKRNFGDSVEIVLRPGCYLTHDAGIYRTAQQRILQRNKIAAQMQSRLQPALQIWTYVQSIPEKQKAIVALGKRDAAFDAGLPVPALHYRAGAGA